MCSCAQGCITIEQLLLRLIETLGSNKGGSVLILFFKKSLQHKENKEMENFTRILYVLSPHLQLVFVDLHRSRVNVNKLC